MKLGADVLPALFTRRALFATLTRLTLVYVTKAGPAAAASLVRWRCDWGIGFKRNVTVGLFNRLITAVKCSNCKREVETAIQFKFGDTWQYNMVIGNEIKWGGNDNGEPGNSIVMVYGIAENNICSHCGFENEEEFNIMIKDNVISTVSPIDSIEKYIEANDCGWYAIR